ncbi:MAG: hypothetical protein V1932_02050 [Chloroflexota bacterium]
MNHLLLSRVFSGGSSGSLPRMNKVFIVPGLILMGLILLLAAFTGCVPKGSYDSVMAENTALKARIPTIVYNSYQDNPQGLTLSYPALWNRSDTQQTIPFFVSPDGSANVGVTQESLPQAMTSDVYFNALNQRLQVGGYTLFGSRQMQVGDIAGVQAVYLNKGLAQVFVVVVKGQTAWLLIETAKANEFIDWAHTFNEIAYSFKVQ